MKEENKKEALIEELKSYSLELERQIKEKDAQIIKLKDDINSLSEKVLLLKKEFLSKSQQKDNRK
ncbi:MAG TPA: hypothetical protein ENN46_00200 [Candidatus Woesearchaeota archaeon]|nr:hypothetical protein [Candidatus Woesearchaeota archaeon]